MPRRPIHRRAVDRRSSGRQPGPRRRRLPGRAPALRRRRLGWRDTPQRRRCAGQPGRPRLGARRGRLARGRRRRPLPPLESPRSGRRPRCRPTSSPRPTGPKDCASWSGVRVAELIDFQSKGVARDLPAASGGRGPHGAVGDRRSAVPGDRVVRPRALCPDGGQGRVRGSPPPPARRGAGGLRARLSGGPSASTCSSRRCWRAWACGTRSNWSARRDRRSACSAAGRHLRDTPFDPFGRSAERRGERRFRDDYLAWVAIALAHLTPATTDAVRAVVDLANDVHGYAHVRQASIVNVHAEAARQLAALTGSEQPVPTRSSVAS